MAFTNNEKELIFIPESIHPKNKLKDGDAQKGTNKDNYSPTYPSEKNDSIDINIFPGKKNRFNFGSSEYSIPIPKINFAIDDNPKSYELFKTKYLKIIGDSSKPYVLSKSKYLKITDSIIQIENTKIPISNIIALEWEQPNLGSYFLNKNQSTYRFRLMDLNFVEYEFICTTNDGNNMWPPHQRQFFHDSFIDLWKIILHVVQKRTVTQIILNMIDIGESNMYRSIELLKGKMIGKKNIVMNYNGIEMTYGILGLKKIVPWNLISYKAYSDKVIVFHKFKLTKEKYFYYNQWNTFTIPVIIDYFKRIKKMSN